MNKTTTPKTMAFKKTWMKLSLVSLSIATLLSWNSSFAQGVAAQNFYGAYSNSTGGTGDPSKPVADRSYFTTSVEPHGKDVKLTVEIWHGALNSPVSLSLQAAVNNGSGKFESITFKELDSKVADNPTNYYSKREFILTYADLNKHLGALLPDVAKKKLKIGPGTPLFVFADFPQLNHEWGGVGRGGIFFMPEDGKGNSPATIVAKARRPVELEVAYPITETMALKYNDLTQSEKPGLKVGGEVGSHVEAEGKFQIPLENTDEVKKALFDLANDPKKAAALLGPDWTMATNTRYMLKDAAGNLVLDSKGMPKPDPMVDTYYDNKDYDAAKNDVNIRYRMTEQNGIGKWGLKPGMGLDLGNGIVRRVEYALDATDSKPETIAKFADSMDPLNPFRAIREAIPGAVPSEFLTPSVEVNDTRYKFELKHSNGMSIEISLDQVTTTSLREKLPAVKYVQMEMDIAHAATSAGNAVGAVSTGTELKATLTAAQKAFLSTLTTKAILDGRPIMHTIADLANNAPVQVKNAADYKLAEAAIEALRDEVLGKNWIPGAQKGSLAVTALGLISEKESSESVKKMFDAKAELAKKGIFKKLNILETSGARIGGRCGNAFGR